MDSSVIPPPINIFSSTITFVYKFIKSLKTKCDTGRIRNYSFNHEPEYVHDKKYAELCARNQKFLANEKVEIRLKLNNNK